MIINFPRQFNFVQKILFNQQANFKQMSFFFQFGGTLHNTLNKNKAKNLGGLGVSSVTIRTGVLVKGDVNSGHDSQGQWMSSNQWTVCPDARSL